MSGKQQRTATPVQEPLVPAAPVVDGPSNNELADEAAVDTGSGTPTLDAIAQEPPPSDPEADAALAREVFSELDDAMGIGVFDLADQDAAMQLLAGRTPSEMAAIRSEYEARTGRKLEDDVAGQFGGPEGNEMMAGVLQGMSLRDKLEHYDTSKSMENLIEHASDEELQQLVTREDGTTDRSVLETLKDKMSEDAYMDARMRLFPEDRVAAVTERIELADNWFDDDEGAAMAAFQSLTPAERKQVLDSSPDLLHYMNPVERMRMEAMTRSEASGLSARMRQATVGAGTDDDSLPQLMEDVAAVRGRQLAAQQELEQSDLSDERRAELESELASIGNLDAIYEVERNEDGSLADGSFLGRLHGDVKSHEVHAHMRAMGFPESEISKQVVLDAMARWNDDEKGVREAFAALPVEERAALWDDPHVAKALEGLNDEELAEVQAFRDDDRVKMAQVRLDDANGIAEDEAAAVSAVLGLSQEERDALRGTDEWASIYEDLDAEEKAALDEVADTGTLSLETGMAAAAGGRWDGTNEELMELASAQRTDTDAVELRTGYVLAREGREPATPEEEAALARFRAVEATFDQELDDDDKQAQLDLLLGHTDGSAAIEAASAEGRMQGSTLNDLRADEKMGPDGDGGGGLADFFIDEDETALQSHQSQKAAHLAAVADGEVDIGELQAHDALFETFGEDYAAMLAAQAEVTDAAATIATTAAMITATIASGGTLGPAAMAFMAQYGTLVTTAGATLTTIGTKELFGGDRYDTFGADGATDLGMAAVDALSSQATGKLGDLALDKLDDFVPALAQPLGQMGSDQLGQHTFKTLREQAPGLLVSNTVDSVLGVGSGALQQNLFTEDFWQQDGLDMLSSVGDSALEGLEGLPQGVAQGFLQSLVTTGLDANAAKRMAADLQAQGIDPSSLDVDQIKELSILQYMQNRTAPAATPDAPVADVADEVEAPAEQRKVPNADASHEVGDGDEVFSPEMLFPIEENEQGFFELVDQGEGSEVDQGSTVDSPTELIPVVESPAPVAEDDLTYRDIPGATAFVQGEGDSHAISPNDAVQGYLGDCYLIASMAAVANADPEAIQDMIRQQEDGSFAVSLHRPDQDGNLFTEEIAVDSSLPFKSVTSEQPHYAETGDVAGGQTEVWAAMIEKAVASSEGGYANIEGGETQWEGTYEALQLLTGREQISGRPQDVADLPAALQQAFDGGIPVTMGTNSAEKGSALYKTMESLGLVPNHMYAPTSVDHEAGIVEMLNPWGSQHARVAFDDLYEHFGELNYVLPESEGEDVKG